MTQNLQTLSQHKNIMHLIFWLKLKKKLWVCLENCKYDLIKRVTGEAGFKVVEEDEQWNLHWIDTSVSIERVMRMKKFQKINHFPGMAEISRKDFLAKNLTRMQKMFPEEYNFFPATFTMPNDANILRDFIKSKKGKTKLTMIVKPSVGCQGKGIYLASKIDDINTRCDSLSLAPSPPFLTF